MWSSPPPTNISKTHLHVEQFSWKTNWNLAEALLSTKAVRKISMWPSRMEKKGFGLGLVLLGEICKEQKVHTGGLAPRGVSRLSHNLGIWVLGSRMEETSPLACWEIHWDRQKGWRSLDSTQDECAHAGLLTVRVERALHWRLQPHCTSQSEEAKALAPTHSTPQPDVRFEQRLGSAMQRQPGGPRVWSGWSCKAHCQHMHGAVGGYAVDSISAHGVALQQCAAAEC